MQEERQLDKDETIEVMISADKMYGIISFTSPEGEGQVLGEEAVRKAIEKAGIIKGLDESKLQQVITEHEYSYKYIIASGKEAVEGKPEELQFHFDKEGLRVLRPKINEDGTVDLRNLEAVKNVKKGQVLVTKDPGDEGEPGYNVLGDIIKVKPQKKVRMPHGKNTKLLPDGLTLVADVDGKLEYDGHNVYINTVYYIMGNLDASIGNVDFIGDVVVYGDVYSGFKICAGGSVQVRGTVEDAIIVAEEDIILERGIQGTLKSKLVAGRNIIAKFIQNATVEAGCDVEAEFCLHTKVLAGNNVKINKGKGLIAGGTVCAAHTITACTIGSPLEISTLLQIGILPGVYEHYKELEGHMIQNKESMRKVQQSIIFLLNKAHTEGLDSRQQELLNKLRATALQVGEDSEKLKAEYEELTIKLEKAHGGKIAVEDTIYPGVKIRFGKLLKYIDREYRNVTIEKIEEDIMIG